MNYRVDEWDASYDRGENAIFYPQTRVVQFVNRYVRKKHDEAGAFTNIIKTDKKTIRCLDFACGIGTHSFFCNEMGFDVVGVDISGSAIEIANARLRSRAVSPATIRFELIKNQNAKLDFPENSFDVSIAESCLDSMNFAVAKAYIAELCRVTEQLIYFSLIGSDMHPQAIAEDTDVETAHEKGTVQSYFDRAKIAELVAGNDEFNLLSCVEETEKDSVDTLSYQRYYCILAKV